MSWEFEEEAGLLGEFRGETPLVVENPWGSTLLVVFSRKVNLRGSTSILDEAPLKAKDPIVSEPSVVSQEMDLGGAISDSRGGVTTMVGTPFPHGVCENCPS